MCGTWYRGEPDRLTKKVGFPLDTRARMGILVVSREIIMAQDMDGNRIKVGDSVGFKSGVEQYGKVINVGSDGYVHVNVWDGDTGAHVPTPVQGRRCWLEG